MKAAVHFSGSRISLFSRLMPVHAPLRVQILFAHLLLLFVSLPFDRMYSHLVLISFLLQLSPDIRKAFAEKNIPWKKMLPPAAIFFCTGLSLLYSPERAEGGKEWLLQLPMLLLPLIMYLTSPVLKQYRTSLLLLFSLVSVLTAVFLFASAVWTIRHFALPLATLFSPAFTNHNFSEPVKMHATYLSMQWVLALVVLLQQCSRSRNACIRAACIVSAFVLLAGLLQLCSKSVGLALLCTSFAGWPLMLKNRTHRLRAIAVSIALLLLSAGIVTLNPAFRYRYLTGLRVDFTRPVAGELAEPRVARWIAALEIARDAPFIGQGAGTEKKMLHELFYRKKYYNSFLNHLNVHSEYISLLIKNGIAGLTVYLLVLWSGFRDARARRDLAWFSFMLLCALVSLGENMLDLDKGVWLYSVFFSFFIFFPETGPAAQPGYLLPRNQEQLRSVFKTTAKIALAGNKS